MTAIARITTSMHAVPLGAGRGGSGATQVDVVLVTVEDTDGASGIGFTFGLTGGAGAVRRLIEEDLVPLAVSAEIDHWPQTWERLWARTHRLGRGHALAAIGGLDIAVHDLLARRQGLPLYRYLGAHAESVEIYGSGRATHQMSDADLIAGARAYVDEGFRAVKLRAGALGLERDVERVAAVRDAVGDSVRIMVDCNERFTLPEALWFSAHMADLDIFWLEEPLRSDDVRGHRQLAATGLPIAVGEHLQGRFEFADYLGQRAASVLQPDPPLCGGVTEWRRISAIAEVGSAVLSPHFLPELNIHLALAVPNCPMVEHFPLIDDVLANTITVVDGRAHPSERPGHGVVFDDDALRRFRV